MVTLHSAKGMPGRKEFRLRLIFKINMGHYLVIIKIKHVVYDLL